MSQVVDNSVPLKALDDMGRDRRGGDEKQGGLRLETQNPVAEAKRLQRAERRRAQAAAEASAREEDVGANPSRRFRVKLRPSYATCIGTVGLQVIGKREMGWPSNSVIGQHTS